MTRASPRSRTRRAALATAAVLATGVGLAAVAPSCSPPKAPPAAPAPTVEDARRFYAGQPRYLRPIGDAPVPADVPNLLAETCGACHTEIYEEWKISTHARALKGDAQFLAELAKSKKPESDVSWMCLNCHTPLENQLERLVTGLVDNRWDKPIYVPNPNWDAKLADDAITCASCHVKDGQIIGVYGNPNAPHAVRADPNWLRSTDVCTQCHQAKAEFPEINLACTFDTGVEHAASPQAAEGKVCQSCHMPEIDRPLTNLDDQPTRRTGRHWFGGSLIPKHPSFAPEIAPLRQHYPDGLALRFKEVPKKIAPKGLTALTVEYENANAGHLLPTGDPERFILVRVEVADDAGKMLATREERIGAVYEWWPKTKKVSDNRLKPKEKRTFEVAFTAPERGNVRVHLSASKWRISEENIRFHDLGGKYVPGVTFYDELRSLPVR